MKAKPLPFYCLLFIAAVDLHAQNHFEKIGLPPPAIPVIDGFNGCFKVNDYTTFYF